MTSHLVRETLQTVQYRQGPELHPHRAHWYWTTSIAMRLMFQNPARLQYYVHKRYALPCQIWFRGIEL